MGTIDAPITDIARGFQDLRCCFTLQSCYGHFIHAGQQDLDSTEALPITDGIADITYRIAYVALCIENSPEGTELLEYLRDIPAAEPEYIQFGSAEWFWSRQLNSYVLQVEPERFKDKDQATVGYQEALHIQDVRDRFFSGLRKYLHDRQKRMQRKAGA
jgi:hypothetical protein